ncbi:uncharacterized protein LOC143277145 [Babylonia areolata]|uniref:uncharacterized protein LOC143277145 n=1 Tax=Babylonia areolata TaxID=304850 RepID=UPI003FCF6CA2
MENNNASASDPEPQQGNEAPPTTRPPPEDTGKKVLNSAGVEVSKWSIRSKIWDHLEKNDLVNFPRPCNNRIPNFVDAAVAAEKVAELEQFKSARTIKINPDKPQENARFLTLEANKTLLVPTPRLRTGLFNKITPPEDANKEMLRKCSTALGTKEHSKKISLKDKIGVDLVIVGSVAVSKEGHRIGKGEGFADLEYAMMATMEAVGPDTVVVTTVHDDQIVEIPEELVEDHDLTVDIIVTPTQVIMTGCKRPKPQGIIWSKLDYEKLYRIPVLRKLRDMEREAGKDVRLKGQEGDDEEFEERMDQERRERGFRGRGNRGMGRRPFRGRRGGGGGGGRFGGRRRPRNDDSADQGDESNKENADESNDNGEGGGERGGRRRRQYRNRGYRRSKPRHSESELSDGAGGEQEGEDGKENRRPPRRRNRRRGMGARSGNSQDNSDGENRRSDGDENRPPPRPRRPRIETSPDGVVFVGGISRRLRVSEFKTEMRGCDVHPVRLVWRGGRGFAFLHFQSADNASTAVKALAGLEIDGRELNVEMARQDNRPRPPRNSRRNPKEAASSESANQESVGSSDIAVEGGER